MSINFAGPYNSGNSTGGAGTSTANVDTPSQLTGLVHGIFVKYNGTPPATTDVTIKTKGVYPHMPSQNLLVLTNVTADGFFPVRKQSVDAAGAAIAAWYDEVPIDDYLNISIAQSNDNTSVDVWVVLEVMGN